MVLPSVVDAHAEAHRILEAATEEAERIVADAQIRAAAATREAAEAGRQQAHLELMTKMTGLVAREEQSVRAQSERIIDLARLLAERILGEELALSVDRLGSLARQVICEARGARRIRLFASPDDRARLAPLAEKMELGVSFLVEVAEDESLASGNLRLETDVGNLGAELGQQLDVLVERLRRSLLQG